MSGFKRLQSKFFWDHMAIKDLGNNAPAYRAGPSSRLNFCKNGEDVRVENEENEECSGPLQNLRTEIRLDNDDTAVRTCATDNASDLSACKSLHNHNTLDCRDGGEKSNLSQGQKVRTVAERRSCSPLSQDLRSQDSGFSDSERSDFSCTYENETPRPRRRRKRRQQRQLSNHCDTQYFHIPRDHPPPTPSHTSTPKDCKNSLDCRLKYGEADSHIIHRVELHDGDKCGLPSSSMISVEGEECLGDFLYVAEPPEDGTFSGPSKLYSINDETELERTLRRSTPALPARIVGETSAARAWLADLTLTTENECCVTLQSKNLPRRKGGNVDPQAEQERERTLSTMATAAASRLLIKAEQFDKHYQYTVEGIMMSQQKGDWRSDKVFIRAIEEHAFSMLSELGAPPPRRIQQRSPPPAREILRKLQELKRNVDDVLDTRLDFYIERVVRELEEVSWENDNVIRGTLAALTALGLAGSRAGSSIARCSGIKVLLTLLVSSVNRSQINDVRAAVLRALASVCCSAVPIERFVRDGGPEILTELLTNQMSPEKIRMETAAVIVQITAPWTNAIGLPYLEPFAKILIPSLSRLTEYTACGQTLLLAVAALNQLSHSKKFMTEILADDSVFKVLRSIKRTTGGNVWIMEQAASLIGQLARFPEARSYLAKTRASVALVCFLRMRPPGVEDAYQKLEFTAAAALTRLCVDPEIARQVVTVGGADCLPTCDANDFLEEDVDETNLGLLKYTKSLRHACRKAAKQIDSARECEF